MRILVVTDLYPPVAFGGYELECEALVDRLRAQHDVEVLTTDLDRGGAPPDPSVHRVLPFMGGRVRPALGAPAAAVRTARTTRALLDRMRPELIYVSNGAALPQVAIQLAAATGAPLVCRFSELWFARNFLRGDRFLRHLAPGERGPRGVWARGLRAVNRHPALRVAPRASFVATVSWASGALRDLAGAPPAIEVVAERVIHPATPRHRLFEAAERAPAERPTVLYVGRLTRAKGALEAVRAVAALRRSGVPAELVMAGPATGGMQRELRRAAAEQRMGDALELTGALPAQAVADLMGRAGVVFVPSVEPEAFPLVVVEAALARAPVVATDVGGIPEALPAPDHALLVEPADPAAAAAALAEALRNTAAGAARVQRAYARARTFSLEAYLDASQELIASAR